MLKVRSDEQKPRRTRGRPKLDEVADIEERLLDVALKEFIKGGYGATSVNRIVRAAGMSKTTVYSRFSSKEQLFRAIMDQQIDRSSVLGSLVAHRRRAGLAQGLKVYAIRTLAISLEGDLLDINRLVYSESHRFPELGATAAERTQIGIRQISSFISECAEADQIPCRDPRRVAEIFILTLRGWYVNIMLTNRPVPDAEREEWVGGLVRLLIASRLDW